MRTGSSAQRRRNRLNQGRVDVRRLLEDREFIKVTAYLLPRRTKGQVLDLMERLRSARMVDQAGKRRSEPPPLPEMTPSETVREINWRVGTLPPGDAETVARYIRRLTRWRGARRRTAARIPARRPDAPVPR